MGLFHPNLESRASFLTGYQGTKSTKIFREVYYAEMGIHVDERV